MYLKMHILYLVAARDHISKPGVSASCSLRGSDSTGMKWLSK